MTRGSVSYIKKTPKRGGLKCGIASIKKSLLFFLAIYDCYIRNNVYLCKGNDDYRNDEYYLNYEVLR